MVRSSEHLDTRDFVALQYPAPRGLDYTYESKTQCSDAILCCEWTQLNKSDPRGTGSLDFVSVDACI